MADVKTSSRAAVIVALRHLTLRLLSYPFIRGGCRAACSAELDRQGLTNSQTSSDPSVTRISRLLGRIGELYRGFGLYCISGAAVVALEGACEQLWTKLLLQGRQPERAAGTPWKWIGLVLAAQWLSTATALLLSNPREVLVTRAMCMPPADADSNDVVVLPPLGLVQLYAGYLANATVMVVCRGVALATMSVVSPTQWWSEPVVRLVSIVASQPVEMLRRRLMLASSVGDLDTSTGIVRRIVAEEGIPALFRGTPYRLAQTVVVPALMEAVDRYLS